MRPPVSVRRLLVLLLIGALASAGPLAYASPPDPAWIAGFWDDGDYDDVVLLATSGVSIADPRPSYEPESVAGVIAVLSLPVESPPPARAPSPWQTRPPPTTQVPPAASPRGSPPATARSPFALHRRVAAS